MNLSQLLDRLRSDQSFMENVTCWKKTQAASARYDEYPADTDRRIIDALEKRGIHNLYTHQASCLKAAQSGKDFVVVTPTASGKTMCYNLPVISEILRNPDSRALYLFPTKALAADQLSELYDLIEQMHVDIKTFTYDGDTPGEARKAVRSAGHVVITNPDMLHSGILPHHTKWVKLFENLKYIVIDEIHSYRGIFGSNLANVLRRLIRLCDFYGSKPRFILCSATIDNPKELAELLTGREILLINNNGAPTGEKHTIFYNPPIINRQLEIRKGVMGEVRRISSLLVRNHIQSIVFARSRLQVEVLTRQLKELDTDVLGNSDRIRGYRGGYLASQRHAIEQGLRRGEIDCVISTNALQLGIDIGALEACVLCGYPGSIASTLQQSGRAGRKHGVSVTIFVASSAPLDQYIVTHPDYFFGSNPENALINPDNLYILMNHFKCSAYELPFRQGDEFGNAPGTEQMLEYLHDANIVHLSGDTFHWSTEDFPASEMSLRTTMTENYLIVDITIPAKPVIIGEMDRFTVPMLLHENAIYMHEGQTYQVEKLDFDACKAFIRQVNVDYYTDADLNVSLSLLDILQEEPFAAYGEVKVTALVKIFKKMKFDTGENLGFGPVRLPETDMHTTAMWWTLQEDTAVQFSKDELQGGMLGISNMLRILAPLYLMCAGSDIALHYQVKCPFTGKPTIILYDNCPGGVGLAEKAYRMRTVLLRQALSAIKDCTCENGCPSCTGPASLIGESGKKIAATLLEKMIEKETNGGR